MSDVADPIRIANCSGFFGDRPSAAREMVEGGRIDVLTGDWLAELTMLILSRIRAKRPSSGYARTFVGQMEDVMGACLEQGIKVVSNAGGLDPDGCAEAVKDVADKLGLNPTIAYVDGDDLMPRLADLAESGALQPFDDGVTYGDGSLGDPSRFLTANAYLGCFGIVEALTQGADIVITGRVTDAAVVCGPAAWHHGWQRDDFDQLAGAVVAGHLIECGAQVTGGNYSFFTEIEGREEIGGRARFGFPWAEIAESGVSLIGKHDGTGGQVSVGTVTSQLLYEIGGPEYLGPDVTARFDSIGLGEVNPDRVIVWGVKGQAPPPTLKVAMNELGGYRNSFSVALTGLDIEEKARFAEATFWDACPYEPDDFESVTSTVVRTDRPDASTQEQATAIWRVTVKDRDERKVGRAFSDANVHTALSSIPGMYGYGNPSPGTPFGVYRPGTVPADLVPAYVHVLGGATTQVESVAPPGPADVDLWEEFRDAGASSDEALWKPSVFDPDAPTVDAPLGRVLGTRSGDKGGNANLGVFVRPIAPSATPEEARLAQHRWHWLDSWLTAERLGELLPEASELEITRYRFPRIQSLNFVIHGLLQEGVAASTRQDGQAKAVGEWLRSRVAPIPATLLGDD